MNICQTLFAELSNSTIRHLRVEPPVTDPTFSTVEVPAIFHIPALSISVETLYYSPETPVRDMFRVIGETVPTNYGSGLLPDFILDYPDEYPALRHLHISSYVSLYPKIVTPEALGRVKQWLEARVEMGRPIQSFKLTGTIYEGEAKGKAGDSKLFDALRDLIQIRDDRHVYSRSVPR